MSEYEGWAITELMGRRSRPGYVREVDFAGGKLLRIDVELGDGKTATEFYGAGAIYSIRPATEDVVRSQIAEWNDPRPVAPLTFRPDPLPPLLHGAAGAPGTEDRPELPKAGRVAAASTSPSGAGDLRSTDYDPDEVQF